MDSLAKQIYWDQDVDEAELRRRLTDPSLRYEAMRRLLEHAPFERIWDYVSLQEIREAWDHLRLRPNVKKMWERALESWE